MQSAYSDLPYVPSEDTNRQALLLSHSLQKHTQHLPSSPLSLWDHTRNLHMYHTHGWLHLSVTYKPPPSPPTIPQCLSPIGQKKFIHLTRPLHNRPVSPRENQLLPQSQCLPSPPLPLLLPIRPPTVLVVINLLRPPPSALLLPPSVSFHSRCGVSHSGLALRSHPCAPPSLHHTGTISL